MASTTNAPSKEGSSHCYVPVYWDWENMHASLLDAERGDGAYRRLNGSPQPPVVRVAPVVRLAESLGHVTVHRAYADWTRFAGYRDELLRHAVEPVHVLPLGARSKSGVDVRMALDALEDLYRLPHTTHVLIATGDADFAPLAQKCREQGRTVVGVGVRGSTGEHWMRSCDRFEFYQDLDPPPSRGCAPDGYELLEEALRELTEQRGRDWVPKAAVRPMMTRLDPSFDERRLGFESFATFVAAAGEAVATRRGLHDHELALRDGLGSAAADGRTSPRADQAR